MSYIIYALQLQEGKFYVGKTHINWGIEITFDEHVKGYGCEWIRKYKPLSIIEKYEHDSEFEEDILTKKYMMKYGIQNVRGGSYTKIELESWQINCLEHEFKNISGHLENECNKSPYNDYLLEFETEDKINEEIIKMENIRTQFKKLYDAIQYYKYVRFSYNNNVRNGYPQVEIEPSIINIYNMEVANLNNREVPNNNEITNNYLYYCIICQCQNYNNIRNFDCTNKVEILCQENVVENIYKVYIHRRKLEIKYLELVKDLEYEDKMNLEEVTKEINKKIELLYEKLGKFYL
jgi:predicted GIY-YIG superfamily endonuclease